MVQRVIPIVSPRFVSEPQLAAAGAAALFGGQRPLALEIGCGIGDFILQLARSQPHTDFLAIDIYNKGCLKTCRKLDAAALDNVRVLRLEARHLLTSYLERDSLSAVYINCPDPWPKLRHRERRLVNADFLRLLLYYLRPGGELFFSTDFADYAEEVATLPPQLPGFHNCLGTPFATELAGYPLSKYMRRFLDLGQPIFYQHLRKVEDFRAEVPPELTQGFRLRWSKTGND